MGFTLTRTNDSAIATTRRTPDQELADHINHNHMKQLETNPPIAVGSEKQIAWAKAIASQFLFYSHAWGFSAEQVDLLFTNKGRYAKFWIDNRCERSGEGTTRIAVEKELAMLERPTVPMSEAELRAKVRRF